MNADVRMVMSKWSSCSSSRARIIVLAKHSGTSSPAFILRSISLIIPPYVSTKPL